MKDKIVYICKNCNYESSKWMGKCSNCSEWNTFSEQVKSKSKTGIDKDRSTNEILLADVITSNSDRIITGINEFDRVMGGGIVKDSVSILTAKPGAGKSTLLLQVAMDLARKGINVLYASGEESESQIKSRADRLFDDIDRRLWVISENSLNAVLSVANKLNPGLIIADSIQTFTLDEFKPSRAGSPTQTMECASELLRLAKNSSSPKAVIMVGQMTKDDELAGLRALEHLVDTVLVIDGESSEELRTLQAIKNRFGSTGEMGFFTLGDYGMRSIDNPSEYFMTKRSKQDIVPGTSLTVAREGSRPIILEIESLVSPSYTPYPSRISDSLSRDRLSTLISILEQKGDTNLFDKTVVIKTTGGIKLKEQSSNLAIAMCIVSSYKNKGIDNGTVFIADLGLTGELKLTPNLESRVKEADRLGFERAFVAKGSLKRGVKFDNIEVVECKTLSQVVALAFNN